MGLVNVRRDQVGVRRHCGRQPRRGGIEDHPGSTGMAGSYETCSSISGQPGR